MKSCLVHPTVAYLREELIDNMVAAKPLCIRLKTANDAVTEHVMSNRLDVFWVDKITLGKPCMGASAEVKTNGAAWTGPELN